MEELRLSFLVFGACAIAGILVHGFWSIRKNAAKQENQSYEPKEWTEENPEDGLEKSDPSDDSSVIDADVQFDLHDPLLSEGNNPAQKEPQFDELGLGEVRVVGKNVTAEDASTEVPEPEQPGAPEIEPEAPKIYASVVTQPKPEYQEPLAQKPVGPPVIASESNLAVDASEPVITTGSSDGMPEPPTSLMKKDAMVSEPAKTEDNAVKQESASDSEPVDPSENVEEKLEKPSLATQAKNLVRRKKAEAPMRRRREPKVDEDQMAINFDVPEEPQIDVNTADASPSAPKLVSASNESKAEKTQQTSQSGEIQQEVLVLNVKVPEDKPIPGSALLPMLLTLGFKFGEQDIFHRHVNSNGKGPVLFSLANMFKPGVFDIDNLENFTTQGVSLFMILPIEGDPHQVFNMMHNAARKIADEFSAQVLDGRRSALTKQSLQQYVEKIREFERQRMIAR